MFERRDGLQHVHVYGLPADGSAPRTALDASQATDVAFAEPSYSLWGGEVQYVTRNDWLHNQ